MNIRDRVKELRRVPASQLKPSPKNWRMHPKEQADALRGLLAEVGFAGAALARELEDGSLELIDGHLRAETTGDMPIPVLVLDVTEEEAGKLLATYDPIGAMATADAAKLEALLQEVSSSNDAVNALLESVAQDHGLTLAMPDPSGGGDEFDPSPEPGVPTRTNTGELWLIGGKHRLIVGDCTDPEVVERLMGGKTPFLMVTDPPYGVEYDPHWRDDVVGEFGQRKARGDGATNDHIVDWTKAYKLFSGPVSYVWHAAKFTVDVGLNLRDVDFEIRACIIWKKQHFALSRGHYHWQHEPCWYAVRKGETANWCGDRTQSTFWEISSLNPAGRTEERIDGHGTQKPLECMARPIRNHGAEGDIVYDPFGGSFTTMIAAHRLGRVFYGCEIEPRYADIGLRRAEAEGLRCEKVG
jgi:DNA modification methylase